MNKNFKSDSWSEMCKHTLRKKYKDAANAARAKSYGPSGGVGEPVNKIIERIGDRGEGFNLKISKNNGTASRVGGVRISNSFIDEICLTDKEFNYTVRFLEYTGVVGDFRCDEREFRVQMYQPVKGCEWMTSDEMQSLSLAVRRALKKRKENIDLLKELVHNRDKEKGRQKVIDMYGGV